MRSTLYKSLSACSVLASQLVSQTTATPGVRLAVVTRVGALRIGRAGPKGLRKRIEHHQRAGSGADS